MIKNIFSLGILISVLLCNGQGWQKKMSEVVNELKKDPSLKHASLGICIMDANSGKILFERNAQQMMTPASTMKTLTTAAALGILGKNFRYETKICYDGDLDQKTGVLNGNIIVIGSGDPSLGSEYFQKNGDTITDIEKEFIEAIKKSGIKKVEGSLIIDNSCFDNLIPDDWIWSDVGNYYGAAPNGLSFKDNKFRAFFSSSVKGEKAKLLKIEPSDLNLDFVNEVYTEGEEEDVVIFRGKNENQRIAKGLIPLNKKNYEIEGSIPNPEIYFKKCLEKGLERIGVTISNKNLKSTGNKTLIQNHLSPELEKIIYYCNLKSNNHYAESILKTIGLISEKTGSLSSGTSCIKKFWKTLGVETEGLIMNDGSGLSRSNGVTAAIEAQILHKAYLNKKIFEVFFESLPICGKTGSLASMGKGTCLEDKLRAKSGYIRRVRAYCGYYTLKEGEVLCFSFIANNYTCKPSEMKKKIERLMESFCDK